MPNAMTLDHKLPDLRSVQDRSLPHDPYAEASILAAMLLSDDGFQEAILRLNEQDFYLPSNRKIFLGIKYLFDHNKPVDSIALADHLQTTGELERVGGRSRLIELSGNYSYGWSDHIDIIKRDSMLRKLIETSAQITALAYDAPEDAKEVVDQAEHMLMSVTNAQVSNNSRSLHDLLGDLYENLERLAESQGESMGVFTGFPTLDKNLLGLRPGQMVVVGARPGIGKTSFALSLAVKAAQRGASVALFSLEMSGVEIAQRLLAGQWGAIGNSHASLQKIRAGNIKPNEWKDICEASNNLSMLDIMVDDTPGTTITEIRAKARRLLHDKPKGLVIIDYLQLVSPPSGRRADSRATEVGEMSRGIKIMAKDLGVPVIALSQLNRQSEGRSSGRAGSGRSKAPQLSDLRESGAIEQDADIVLLLDRSQSDEEAERPDRPGPGETDLIIAKNRSGPLGKITLGFFKDTTDFLEVDKTHDEM